MQNFCPHCGSDISGKLLDYYEDIARMGGGFEIGCPHCDQLIAVSVRIGFELRKLPLPE